MFITAGVHRPDLGGEQVSRQAVAGPPSILALGTPQQAVGLGHPAATAVRPRRSRLAEAQKLHRAEAMQLKLAAEALGGSGGDPSVGVMTAMQPARCVTNTQRQLWM